MEQTVEEFNLVLFSGLAADSNVFIPQRNYFGQMVHVVPWLEPLPGEGLSEYSKRLVQDYGQLPNLVLAGASFGGLVAQYAALHVKARGLILIGSMRDPQDLPRLAKLVRHVHWLVDWLPVWLLKVLASTALSIKIWPKAWNHLRAIVEQFADCNANVFKWSLRQLLSWSAPVSLSLPIFQIHGGRDIVLPLPKSFGGAVVQEAGHVLSLSHPREVNRFIEECLLQIKDGMTSSD